jgi:hypothetical protein
MGRLHESLAGLRMAYAVQPGGGAIPTCDEDIGDQ